MDIDKLIEEKTECFTGNGDYYFTYVTPEDCKKIVQEVLKQGQSLPIDSVSDIIEPNYDEMNKQDLIIYCEYLKLQRYPVKWKYVDGSK